MFATLGFVIGLLLRKMSLSLLLFLVMHLIVPSVGKYDYKNLVLTVFSYGFDLDSGKKANFIDGVGFLPSVLLFALYLGIFFGIAILVYMLKKRKGSYI